MRISPGVVRTSRLPQNAARMVPDIPEWYADAICPQVDLDGFYPETGNSRSAREACRVCDSCPVKQKCLDYAMENYERWGVWGGTTAHERQILWGWRER